MIQNFTTLQGLDLRDHVSKKPTFSKDRATGQLKKTGELDYLNWADCLALLYQHGAEKVIFGNVRSREDHPVFLLDGKLPFVRVYIEIDGDRRELDYPVIDGSKDIDMDRLTQSDVHNATQRGFVKCVAVNWGLGLSLWQKEEKAAAHTASGEDLVAASNIYAIQERIERRITALLQRGRTMEELYGLLGLRKGQFETLMKQFRQIDTLEQRLTAL